MSNKNRKSFDRNGACKGILGRSVCVLCGAILYDLDDCNAVSLSSNVLQRKKANQIIPAMATSSYAVIMVCLGIEGQC